MGLSVRIRSVWIWLLRLSPGPVLSIWIGANLQRSRRDEQQRQGHFESRQVVDKWGRRRPLCRVGPEDSDIRPLGRKWISLGFLQNSSLRSQRTAIEAAA